MPMPSFLRMSTEVIGFAPPSSIVALIEEFSLNHAMDQQDMPERSETRVLHFFCVCVKSLHIYLQLHP